MPDCVIKCNGVTQFILRYVMRGIRLKTKKSMKKYEVTFKQYVGGDKSSVVIATDLKLEDSVQFALNLHRSSNCNHVIGVYLVSEGNELNSSVVEFYLEK